MNLIMVTFLFFFLSSFTDAHAELDPMRQQNYETALSRYGTGSSSQNVQGQEERKKERQPISESITSGQRQSLNFSFETLELGDEVYWRHDRSFPNKEQLNINGNLDLTTRLRDSNISYGESLYQSVFNKVGEFPGQHILVTSDVTAEQDVFPGTDDEPENKSLRANHSYTNEFEDVRITFLGSISHSQSFFNNTTLDTSLAVLKTTDFDPCLLEQSATARLFETGEELSAQGKYNINANCMITENLEGDFSVNLLFTGSDGEVLRKVELDGDLTLSISTALALKYSAESHRGENPIRDTPQFFSRNFGTNSFNPTQTTRIENFFFVKPDVEEGTLHEFILEHKSDESDYCVTTNSLTVGAYENEDENTPLFSINYLKKCDQKVSEEELESRSNIENQNRALRASGLSLIEVSEDDTFTPSTREALSFGNTLERRGENSPVLTYSKSYNNEFSSTAYSISAAHLPENELFGTDAENIFLFDYSVQERNDDGTTDRTVLKVFHSTSESYVVTQQILIFPTRSEKTQLALQDPILKDSQIEKARAVFESLGRSFGDDEIKALLENRTNLKDPNLCSKIRCFEFGTALSFTNQGGVFMTIRGRTMAEVFGNDVRLEIIAGTPLNSEGENRSWGRQSSFFSFSGSDATEAGSTNRNLFLEVNFSSASCDSTKEVCSEFSIREEDDSTDFTFGGIRRF